MLFSTLTFPPFYSFANFFLQLSLSPFLLDSQYSTIPFIFYTFLILFFNFPLSTRFQFHYFDNIFSTIPVFFYFIFSPFVYPSPISFLISLYLFSPFLFYPFSPFPLNIPCPLFSFNFSPSPPLSLLLLNSTLIRNIVYSLPFTRPTCNPLKQPRYDSDREESSDTQVKSNLSLRMCRARYAVSICEEGTIGSRQIT